MFGMGWNKNGNVDVCYGIEAISELIDQYIRL